MLISYIRLGQFWNQAQCPSGKPVPKFSKNLARKNKKNIDVGMINTESQAAIYCPHFYFE